MTRLSSRVKPGRGGKSWLSGSGRRSSRSTTSTWLGLSPGAAASGAWWETQYRQRLRPETTTMASSKCRATTGLDRFISSSSPQMWRKMVGEWAWVGQRCRNCGGPALQFVPERLDLRGHLVAREQREQSHGHLRAQFHHSGPSRCRASPREAHLPALADRQGKAGSGAMEPYLPHHLRALGLPGQFQAVNGPGRAENRRAADAIRGIQHVQAALGARYLLAVAGRLTDFGDVRLAREPIREVRGSRRQDERRRRQQRAGGHVPVSAPGMGDGQGAPVPRHRPLERGKRPPGPGAPRH